MSTEQNIQFSMESIKFLADKTSDCRYLSEDCLIYLTLQTSELIFRLLQDASKVLRKCRRKRMNTDDFEFALKLHHLEPIFGGYTTRTIDRSLFCIVKKEKRLLHYIHDDIVQLNTLIASQPHLPLDISIRAHWLAIDGKQPTINENPVIDNSRSSSCMSDAQTKKKFDGTSKISHVLSAEQQLLYKELTEMCICSDGEKRRQVLLILSSDSGLQQIVARLALFISEGVRVNLATSSSFDLQPILSSLMQMIDALLKNEALFLEPYLHHLLPAVLSCLLERRLSRDHWSLRDFAARCCGQIIQKYSTTGNQLQQRTINVLLRILTSDQQQYAWSTQYGALVGLCEMGQKVIVQIVFPIIKQLGERVRSTSDREAAEKMTDSVLKFISTTCHSTGNERENSENKLNNKFGSYFGSLIHHQLVLLL